MTNFEAALEAAKSVGDVLDICKRICIDHEVMIFFEARRGVHLIDHLPDLEHDLKMMNARLGELEDGVTEIPFALPVMSERRRKLYEQATARANLQADDGPDEKMLAIAQAADNVAKAAEIVVAEARLAEAEAEAATRINDLSAYPSEAEQKGEEKMRSEFWAARFDLAKYSGAKDDAIQQAVTDAADKINRLCPDGRHKSLALTSLEQAFHWALRAVQNEVEG